MIRVLRVITRLNIGGPSIQAVTLCDRLAARGFETLLIHGRLDAGEGDMRYLLAPHAAVEYLPTLRRPVAPVADAAAMAHLVRTMRAWRPHIVHTHMAKAGALGRAAAAIANAGTPASARAKTVHTYHGHVLEGYFGAAKTAAFLGVERQLARITDRIVAISPRIRAELLDGHRIGTAAQYRVVPLGFDLAPFGAVDDSARQQARSALGVPAGAHVVATVGRLTAIKDHRLFLAAAAEIARADPAAIFLIVGDGELRRDLEAAARSLGLAERTRFLGWRRDLAVVYGATDVFMLTSKNEGTPVALIESLAAAVPAVSTDVGGVRDVLDTERSGLLAPAGDASALAQHAIGLLRDRDRRRAMGVHGRSTVLARYSVDRLVNDVEALYRELLG